MRKDYKIALLKARLNRLERNGKGNQEICRKIRRKIRQLNKTGPDRP